MSRPRPRARLAVLAAALLVGCTGSQPLPSPSTPAPVAADAVQDTNPQPRERLRDGGLLRFPLAALPTQWNPRHPDADADARRVLDPLTPEHLALDAAGRATPNPDFVTDVAVSHEGHTVVTLTLNPTAVWGDAAPLTAEDWVATWRASTGQVEGVAPVGPLGWDRVTDVRAGASAYEVVVTYAGVDPDWAQPLVPGPLRASTVASADAFAWASHRDAHYAAPFLVAHVDQAQGLVTLERNPLWWGDRPKLDTIMFRTVQAEAVAAAFQHNELDVWETGTSVDRLQQSRAAADTTLRTAPGTHGRSLLVSRAGLLADAALRRAVLMAIDRAEVGASDLADLHEPPRTWSSNLLLPTQPGYVDQARATGLANDPVRAAEALDAAGWVEGPGSRSKDGQRLLLTFRTPIGDDLAQGEFEVLAGQLAAVGVRLRAVTGEADLTPVSVPVDAFPLARLPEDVASVPAAAELVARVASEVDPVRRADQASQLARLAWQEVVEIPLYQEPQFVAVRNGLANLGAPGYATTDWEDVGWTS